MRGRLRGFRQEATAAAIEPDNPGIVGEVKRFIFSLDSHISHYSLGVVSGIRTDLYSVGHLFNYSLDATFIAAV